MRPKNDVAYPIQELLQQRWSPRAFDPNRSLSADQLRLLTEAARWTPSAFNAQPWSFVIARRDEAAEFEPLLQCLGPYNQVWAKHAAALILAVGDNTYAHNGKPNRHGAYDTGAAVANLTLQATALGLHVHQMAGFDADKARQTYAIPATVDPMAVLAVGYLGDPATLSDELQKREATPSVRKPIGDFVFSGRYGRPAPWTGGER